MKWIGTGPELFSVRVDVVAPDEDRRWVSAVEDALIRRLPFTTDDDRALAGADEGRGHEGQPVVGLTFLVRAKDFGSAAQLAVEAAANASSDVGLSGRIYDVVLVPEDAIALPVAPRDIPMPT